MGGQDALVCAVVVGGSPHEKGLISGPLFFRSARVDPRSAQEVETDQHAQTLFRMPLVHVVAF